ncbi:MAG TPA: hypothetical protein PKD96_04260, partial [Candidatus Absconditabacterales bacterium]|nr:hypothetical protein [Candidatus Absconditabacterales bacterium]
MILGVILGIFGGGGNVGKLIFIDGKKEGNGGRFGGVGKIGKSGIETDGKSKKGRSIVHKFRVSKSIVTGGGSGRFGTLGNGIELGTKLNLGSKTSIPKSILE